MRATFLAVFLATLSAVYCGDGLCKSVPESTIIPNREDCTKFSRCIGGKLVERACPQGQEFDEIREVCDDPIYSACHAFELHIDRTPTLRRLCGYFGNGYLLPNIDDCTKFYECAYQEPKEFVCPRGLVYNDPRKTCDYPERTDCSKELRLPFPDIQALKEGIINDDQ